MTHGGSTGLGFALATLLTGCVIVPAAVTTSREVTTPRLEEPRTIAVLYSPDFSPETPERLGTAMVECIERALRATLPAGAVVPPDQFYDRIFPGLTPSQVLLRAESLPLLVVRPPVRQRLDELRLSHLILVEADYRSDVNIGAVPTGVGAIWEEQVKMTAVLFELRRGRAVGSATTQAVGKGAFFFPLGGGTVAIPPACAALATETARMIRGEPQAPGR